MNLLYTDIIASGSIFPRTRLPHSPPLALVRNPPAPHPRASSSLSDFSHCNADGAGLPLSTKQPLTSQEMVQFLLLFGQYSNDPISRSVRDDTNIQGHCSQDLWQFFKGPSNRRMSSSLWKADDAVAMAFQAFRSFLPYPYGLGVSIKSPSWSFLDWERLFSLASFHHLRKAWGVTHCQCVP